MTTSTAMTRLINNIRARLPGATDGLINFELYNVLNDWFQDTNMWYEDIEFPVFANTASAGQEPDNVEYLIATNQTAAIVRLMGVVDDQGLPVGAYMPAPGTVRLAYSPNGNVNFTARFALTVNDPVGDDNIPDCPDWVINKYQNDLINGVVGRMMSMTAKPFSNERLAVYHSKAFQSAIANARVEQNRQNTYRGQVWKFPQSFNRRRWR